MAVPRLSTAPFKDLKRATEIVQILVSHGFGTWLSKPVLKKVKVDLDETEGDRDEVHAAVPMPVRVRALLEALGPTFVKLGQVLSTRADIVPEAYAQALKSLQDDAPPLPFETIKDVIEEELKRPLSLTFVEFEPEPLASASIAQVHRAVIERNGERVEVVCKVQRPGIRQVMSSDLSLVYWLGKLLQETIEEVSAYSPTAIVEQFETAIAQELDFVHERHNLERARTNFSTRPELLVVPEAFAELSTERVLTMTYLDGIKVTDVKGDPRYDLAALRDRLVETAFKQAFEDGFFHGDPHPGNVLVLPDGRIGMIDFGLMGHLTSEQQDVLIHWLTAIALKSPGTLARLTLKVGEVPPGFDRMAYEREVRVLMDKYVGVEIQSLDASSIITDSIEVVRKHRIKLPPDFAVLARATATLEGIVRHLYPELDVQALILPYVQKLVLQRMDWTRAGPEAMSLVLGLQTFVNEVPGQLNQLLHDLSAGRFQVGIQGEPLADLDTTGRMHSVRTVQAILAGALLVAAAITLAPFKYTVYQVPVVPVLAILGALWSLSALTLTFVFPKGLRKIRLSRFMFWRR